MKIFLSQWLSSLNGQIVNRQTHCMCIKDYHKCSKVKIEEQEILQILKMTKILPKLSDTV